eukprot:gb/GECG01004754.1/.p1 GENE.gb/GECG01004754.1/~~gb/GECG01004754.1/.p1  ORF type:complete len:1565 (+),score=234.06 gb/GECG01004754.1/:1-4695(+)
MSSIGELLSLPNWRRGGPGLHEPALGEEIASLGFGKNALAVVTNGHGLQWSVAQKDPRFDASLLDDRQGGKSSNDRLARPEGTTEGALFEETLGERIPELPEGSLDQLDILQVAFGQEHGLILTRDGSVLSFGSNCFGQLGISSLRSSASPVLLQKLQELVVVQIAAGNHHSVALTDTGGVYTWGRNYSGELGLSHPGKDAQQTEKDSLFGCRIGPQFVQGLRDIQVRKVCCGGRHTVALTSEGDVYCWGESTSGQVGIGIASFMSHPMPVAGPSTDTPPVIDIACGEAHTLALSETGSVYGWGLNHKGQLGVTGTVTCIQQPTLLRRNEIKNGEETTELNTSFVIGSQIGAGAYFSVVLDSEYSLVGFGELPQSLLDTDQYLVLNDSLCHQAVDHAHREARVSTKDSVEESVFPQLEYSPARSDSAGHFEGKEEAHPPETNEREFDTTEKQRQDELTTSNKNIAQSRNLRGTVERAEAASAAACRISMGALKKYGPAASLSGSLKKTAMWKNESPAQVVLDEYREKEGNPLRRSMDDRRYHYDSPALRPKHLLPKGRKPMNPLRRFSRENRVYAKLGGGKRRFAVDDDYTNYARPTPTPDAVFHTPHRFSFASYSFRKTSALHAGKHTIAVTSGAELTHITPRTSSIDGGTVAVLSGPGLRTISRVLLRRNVDSFSGQIPSLLRVSKKELLTSDKLGTVAANFRIDEPECSMVRIPDTFVRFSYLHSLELDDSEQGDSLTDGVEDQYAAAYTLSTELNGNIDLECQDQTVVCFIPPGSRASEMGVQLYVRRISAENEVAIDQEASMKETKFAELDINRCVLSSDAVRAEELDAVEGIVHHSYFVTPQFNSIEPSRCTLPPKNICCRISGESTFAVMLSDPHARPFAVALIEYVENQREERENHEADTIENGITQPPERLCVTSEDPSVKANVEVEASETHLVGVRFRLLKGDTEISVTDILPAKFIAHYDEIDEEHDTNEEKLDSSQDMEQNFSEGKFTAVVEVSLPSLTLDRAYLLEPPPARPIPVPVPPNEPSPPSEPRPEETDESQDKDKGGSNKSSRKSSSRSKPGSKTSKRASISEGNDDVKEKWHIYDQCCGYFEHMRSKQSSHENMCAEVDELEEVADRPSGFSLEALVSPCGPQLFPCTQRIEAQPAVIDRIEPHIVESNAATSVYIRGVGFSENPIVKLECDSFIEGYKQVDVSAQTVNAHSICVSIPDCSSFLKRPAKVTSSADDGENADVHNDEEGAVPDDERGAQEVQHQDEEDTDEIDGKALSPSCVAANLKLSLDGGVTFVEQFTQSSSSTFYLYSGVFECSSQCFVDPKEGGKVVLKACPATDWFGEHINPENIRVRLRSIDGSLSVNNWDQVAMDTTNQTLSVFLPSLHVLNWLAQTNLEASTPSILCMDVSLNGFGYVTVSESVKTPLALLWDPNKHITVTGVGPKKLALGGEISIETKGWGTLPQDDNLSIPQSALIERFQFVTLLTGAEDVPSLTVQLTLGEDSHNALMESGETTGQLTFTGNLPESAQECPTGNVEVYFSIDNGATWLDTTTQIKIPAPGKKK